MIFAPLAGFLTSYIRCTRIMAVGLALFVIASACASISRHFYPLLLSRTILGFGEATFAGLAPAIIDDIALPRLRSLWISIYFMAMPVGTAIGYVVAGSVSTLYSWRLVFAIEAVLMLPFPFICFFLPEVSVIVANSLHKLSAADRRVKEEQMRLRTNEQTESASKRTAFNSIWALLTNPVYIFSTLGYGFLTFTIGGISLWAADFFTGQLNAPLDYVTKMFGIVSAVAGILGAALGGLISDKLGGTQGRYGIPRTLMIAIVFSVPGVVSGVICMTATSPVIAFLFSGFAMACFVAIFSPIVGVILAVVPSDLRAFGFSISLFVAHLIGDFPSPSVVGLLKNAFDSLMYAMVVLCLWSLGATCLWLVAFILSLIKARRGDYDEVAVVEVVAEGGEEDIETEEEGESKSAATTKIGADDAVFE